MGDEVLSATRGRYPTADSPCDRRGPRGPRRSVHLLLAADRRLRGDDIEEALLVRGRAVDGDRPGKLRVRVGGGRLVRAVTHERGRGAPRPLRASLRRLTGRA